MFSTCADTKAPQKNTAKITSGHAKMMPAVNHHGSARKTPNANAAPQQHSLVRHPRQMSRAAMAEAPKKGKSTRKKVHGARLRLAKSRIFLSVLMCVGRETAEKQMCPSRISTSDQELHSRPPNM